MVTGPIWENRSFGVESVLVSSLGHRMAYFELVLGNIIVEVLDADSGFGGRAE